MGKPVKSSMIVTAVSSFPPGTYRVKVPISVKVAAFSSKFAVCTQRSDVPSWWPSRERSWTWLRSTGHWGVATRKIVFIDASQIAVSMEARSRARVAEVEISLLFGETGRELSARAHIKLAVNPREIRLNRLHAQVELCSNFFVRTTGGHELGNATLRMSQRARRGRSAADPRKFCTRPRLPQRRTDLLEELVGVLERRPGEPPLLHAAPKRSFDQ